MDLKSKSGLFYRPWAYPALLMLVMLAAYGLQFTRLGLYWDDWQAVFLSLFKNPEMYWDFFLGDRPISAWTFIVTMPILGGNPLAWHIFTLLVRWASVLAFCWALQGLWPGRNWQVRWMGLLLAVFPGFSQQSISVAYSQHFITYALFTFSLGCMVWSLRQPRRYGLYLAAGLFTSLLHMLTMEYFMVLELVRPLMLWFILDKPEGSLKNRAARVFLHWLPYLFMLAAALVWRFWIYPTLVPGPIANTTPILSQLIASPAATLQKLAQMILQDTLQTLIFAWTNVILPAQINLEVRFILFSWLGGALVAAAAVWLLQRMQPAETLQPLQEETPSFPLQALLLGVSGLVLGGLPFWSTERQIIVGLWSDRFSLGPMFGAVTLLVCLLDWSGGRRTRLGVFFSLLLGLGVAFQVQVANRYAQHGDLQRDFYWQLYWRVPALKPGTSLLIPEIPFSYMSTESLGFSLNALYDPKPGSTQLSYWFLDALRYRGTRTLREFKEGIPISYELRNMTFNGNTTQSLGVSYNNARGCLRLLDPVYRGAPLLLEGEDQLYPVSHPQQVLAEATESARPSPETFFGPEPEHGWCYFYQKADLARQVGDWQAVVGLWEETGKLKLQPNNGAELLPFIEAYARLGDWEKAAALVRPALAQEPKLLSLMCSTWKRSLKAAGRSQAGDAAVAEFKCP